MEIDFEEINNYSYTIIDIRSNDDYLKKHLERSINIPFEQLIINFTKYLDKHKKYLLVCEYGLKSKKTCELLRRNGFSVYSLRGGIIKIK